MQSKGMFNKQSMKKLMKKQNVKLNKTELNLLRSNADVCWTGLVQQRWKSGA